MEFRLYNPGNGSAKRIIYKDVMIGHFVENEGTDKFIDLYHVYIDGILYYVDGKVDKNYKTICYCQESEVLKNAIDMFYHNCLVWLKDNGAK